MESNLEEEKNDYGIEKEGEVTRVAVEHMRLCRSRGLRRPCYCIARVKLQCASFLIFSVLFGEQSN